MQLIFHIAALCSFGDEGFHRLQLIGTSSFESARVMKNKLRVARKYHLVFDIMETTLVTWQQAVS